MIINNVHGVNSIHGTFFFAIHNTKTRRIDGFNYRVWHYENYRVTKIGSHFVGQKRNKVNRVLLTKCLRTRNN